MSWNVEEDVSIRLISIAAILAVSVAAVVALATDSTPVVEPAAEAPKAKTQSETTPTPKVKDPRPQSALDRILATDRPCPINLDLGSIHCGRSFYKNVIPPQDAGWLYEGDGTQPNLVKSDLLSPFCKVYSNNKILSVLFTHQGDYDRSLHVMTFKKNGEGLKLVSSFILASDGGDAEDVFYQSATWIDALTFDITYLGGEQYFDRRPLSLMSREHYTVSIDRETGAITRNQVSMDGEHKPTKHKDWLRRQSLPPGVADALSAPSVKPAVYITSWTDLFYLQGDFNGDGVLDTAVQVANKHDRPRGIAIVHGGGGEVHILGAGNAIGSGGKDFLPWMHIWRVYHKQEVFQGVGEGPPPTLLGDALYVAKAEAASGLIYWGGEHYRWYQQAD